MPSICQDSRRIPEDRERRRSVVISEPYWISRAGKDGCRTGPIESEKRSTMIRDTVSTFDNEKRLPPSPRTKPSSNRGALNRRQTFALLLLIAQLAFIFHHRTGFSTLLHPTNTFSSHPTTSLTPQAQSILSRCSALPPLSPSTYPSRLAHLRSALHSSGKNDFYIAEPGASGSYFVDIGKKQWHLSERPFLIVVSQSFPGVLILTPKFEADRARLLSIPGLSASQITYLEWAEASSPYETLVSYLNLTNEGAKIHVDPWVRSFVSYGLAEELEKRGLRKVEVGLAGREVRGVREKKTEEEIEFLRCANELTLEGMKITKTEMFFGIKESETSEILSKNLKSLGLEDGEGLVLFGENAALPHGTGTDRTLTDKDLVLIDCGGTFRGYVSDITRTFALPHTNLSPLQHRLHSTVLSAQLSALSAVVPGSTGATIDAAARAVVEQRGERRVEREGFSHRLGHGIGLEGHEAPFLVGSNGEELEVGNVFSDEPGVYILGEVGVRLEDCFYVDKDGKGKLFTGPVKDIWSI